jgi:hypothetical protein
MIVIPQKGSRMVPPSFVWRTAVDTVIHEIAHHISGAEDAEEAHNAQMTTTAARVVEETARGLLMSCSRRCHGE